MVAPIKGMVSSPPLDMADRQFARRLYKDIAISCAHSPAPANPSLTAGTIGGYWFWYQVHVPMSAY